MKTGLHCKFWSVVRPKKIAEKKLIYISKSWTGMTKINLSWNTFDDAYSVLSVQNKLACIIQRFLISHFRVDNESQVIRWEFDKTCMSTDGSSVSEYFMRVCVCVCVHSQKQYECVPVQSSFVCICTCCTCRHISLCEYALPFISAFSLHRKS